MPDGRARIGQVASAGDQSRTWGSGLTQQQAPSLTEAVTLRQRGMIALASATTTPEVQAGAGLAALTL
jgi:hypothetical protein